VFRRRVDTEQWQPRLWAILIGLVLLVGYVIAFIVENDKQVKLHFVLFSADVSLIWAMILIFAFGLLGGVLLSQLYRRRARQAPR
jgi:uncharacterized integral membrane protein